MAVIISFDSDTAVPYLLTFAENEGQHNASDAVLLQRCFISTFIQMSSQVAK